MSGLWARLSLYAAALATGGSFAVMFEGNSGEALLILLGATLAAILAGSAGRYRFLITPPVIAAYTLAAVYGPPPLTPGRWKGLLGAVPNDARDGVVSMYMQMVPYDTEPGVMLLLMPVAMLVVAFSVSATLYEDSPLISVAVMGVTIAMISTVSFEVGIGPYFALFLAASVALLLFDGSMRLPSPVAAVSAGGVVAFGLTLPGVGMLAPQGLIDWTSIGEGGSSRLSTQADVGEYLNEGRDTELMRVRSPEPMLWRGGTLDYFDGARWRSTADPGREGGQEISDAVETRYVEQNVTVLNSRSRLIFGGYKVQAVSFPGAEQRPDGSWTAGSTLSQGTSYRTLSEIPQPTAAQLNNAGTEYSPYIREKYLQAPGDLPPVVGQTAQRVQSRYSPQTPYQKARAIERYLLYDGDFTYNLAADYRRADTALEEFLGGDGEGFCTQFATSMALMARDMGVPSRVVYGATSGQQIGDDEYMVTGANMHTWVEIYFPGIGWYPFNPTPSISTPSVMQQNAPRPSPDQPPAQDRAQRSPAGQIGGQQQSQAPQQSDSGGPAGEGGPRLWPLHALGGVALLGSVLAGKRLLAARGRPEGLYRDLCGRLMDVPGPNMNPPSLPSSLTPTERMVALAEAAGLPEAPFKDFAGLYSEHLYSEGTPEGLRPAYHRAISSIEKVPRWRRAVGWVNPVSLPFRAKGFAKRLQSRR